MPTNLPPEYFEVEKKYRSAETIEEKISTLEELIGTVPKHKGTDKLRADMRLRLSKLKASAQSQKRISRQESVFNIEREGAGQVVLLGLTNVGKSALVNALTNANPLTSENPFTTWNPTPGMMLVDNVQIQLIDTPPLDRDFLEPEFLNLIRRSDLGVLVIDLQASPTNQLEQTLSILNNHQIQPSDSGQRFMEGGVTYLPMFALVNKNDDEQSEELFEIFCDLIEVDIPCISVSAITQRNFDQLKTKIFRALNLVRIYSKKPGREPDLATPFVLKKGSTLQEFAGKIHQDFAKKLKSARIWGSGAFDGQMVSRDHILQDGDIVELKL